MDINGSEGGPDNETISQFNRTIDDRNSESFEYQSSVPEISPPTSPVPFRRDILDTDSNFGSIEISNQGIPSSPYSTSEKPERRRIRSEMMKLFKISTGGQREAPGSQESNELVPLVTSVPRDSKHCLLLLFRLEVPKVLGTVSRLAVNSTGFIAGCTVHGEMFVFSRLPYSRFPDALTRGHDGGIVSITWLTGPVLSSCFITNGTDKKTLVWQVTDHGIDGPYCDIKQPAVPTSCCIHPVNKDIVFIGLIDNTFAMYKVEKTLDTRNGDDAPEEAVRMLPLGIGGSFTKPITAMSVSPDGRKLAVGSSVGTVGFFDLNTMSFDVEVDCRNRQGKTSGGRKVVGLDWSHDSECVLVSSCDSRLRVVLVSDLSRRTKFKSSFFTNDNLFLSAAFGPPDDSRIVAVSESGHLCMWRLHAGSETNENCLRCNLVDSGMTKKFNDKDKSSSHSTEITASVLVDAGDPFCSAIQAKTFYLGDSFQLGYGMAFVICDTSGSIRIFAELFRPRT